MDEIVRFVVVNNKIDIENYLDYIDKKIKKVLFQMGVEDSEVYCDVLEESEKVSLDNSNECYSEFTVIDEKYFIVFSFNTFSKVKQLEVSINKISDGEVLKDVINDNKANFIERFKVILKNNILYEDNEKKIGAWEKCIWLVDKQSQEFASKLYPMIYETENIYRELINLVMIKILGADWWNIIVPLDIKDEQRSKVGQYKSIIEDLNDVDETLLSIEVSKLSKLIKLKRTKWIPKYERSLEDLLLVFKKVEGTKNIKERYLKDALNILKGQLAVEDDLWEKYFSKLLPTDFFERFNEFSSNRNHIAHNKIIDRQAYYIIKKSIESVKKDLEDALLKVDENIKSFEKIEFERIEKEYDEHEEEQFLREIMESESGVEIEDQEGIFDIFNEAINRFHDEVKDRLRFRMDIEVEDVKGLRDTTDLQDLFIIEHLVVDEIVSVCCKIAIDTYQGAQSILTIIVESNRTKEYYEIPYINGEVYYDDDQCTYMPKTEDEFGERQLQEAIDETVDFINSNLESLREKVDNEMYRIIKEGANSPVANICCWNCGESYISIDENYAEFGRCLNCGEMNELYECEKCESYCNELYDVVGVEVCENCYNKFRCE